MLLPDNIHPEQSIYFNGAFVLNILHKQNSIGFFDLFLLTKSEKDMSMPVFILCLDWLFLLNLIAMEDNGMVATCY